MGRQVHADTVIQQPVAPGLLFMASDLLTYQQAEKNEGDSTTLYVANAAQHAQPGSQSKAVMAMELMFEVKTPTGPVLVRMPATWIPIDITTQIDRKTLLATPEFRRFTLERKILIVKTDVAERILTMPEAQEEFAKIQAKSSTQKNDEYYDMLSNIQDGSLVDVDLSNKNAGRPAPRANKHTGRPTGIVNRLEGRDNYTAEATILQADSPEIRPDIAAITNGQFSEATIIAIISAHQNTLTLEECNYIIKNVKSEAALDISYARLGQIAQSRG